MDIVQLERKAQYIRREAFEMVMKAGKGHLGGSFSCAEILVALYYGGILKVDPRSPQWDGRDRFVMSKGHANNTLYAVLADVGFFSISELANYTRDGSMLGGHCDNLLPGIEIVSGSLGHGLGIAAGMALGAKLNKKNYLVFAVIGDGESQEGSIWEAAMFSHHHHLNNLITVLDRNRLGSEDFTENTCDLEPVGDKWSAFGWEVRSVDGHSIGEILNVLKDCRTRKSDMPLLVIANTVKGKGISSLENRPRAHHTLPKGEEIINTRQGLL